MNLSYLLIFLYLIIFIVSFFSSYNHVFKTSIAGFISLAMIGLVIYLDLAFNSLGIITYATKLMVSRLGDLLTRHGIKEIEQVCQGLLLLGIYIIVFLVVSIFTSFGLIGKLQPLTIKSKISSVAFSLLHFFVFAITFSYIFCYISPLLRLEKGFLKDVINFFSMRIHAL